MFTENGGGGVIDMVHSVYGKKKVKVGVPSCFFPGLSVSIFTPKLDRNLCTASISAISVKRQWISFYEELPKSVKPGCLLLLEVK